MEKSNQQDGVREEAVPRGVGFVGGEDNGFALPLSLGYDLEDEGGVVLFEGEIANFEKEEKIESCMRVLESPFLQTMKRAELRLRDVFLLEYRIRI